MPGLTLEPFAARIRWQRRSADAAGRWEDLLRELVAAIASESRRLGARLIGHIKGIASAEGQFLRIDCVSERIAPDVEGALPESVREIELDLAVLVYGLTHAQVKAAVEAALGKCHVAGRTAAVLEAPSRGSAHA